MAAPRVLVLTQLFPNSLEPGFATFNRQQFAALSKLTDVKILGTLPWFPGARWAGRFSRAGRITKVPKRESVFGLEVHHPRFLTLPKVPRFAPRLYAESIWPTLRQYRGQVDVLLAAWAFPDGVAAALLARRLGVPLAVKLHGTDINTLPSIPAIRSALRWGLPRADRVIAVSQPLKRKAIQLGADPTRCRVVRNGVDRQVFCVRPRDEVRALLGVPQRAQLVTFVGTIMKEKGVFDLLDAFELLAPHHPQLHLALVGKGPALEECRQRSKAYRGRVTFAGQVPLPDVANWISAGDLFTLPSWAEGTPNVVLEALACGRPVVATNVGGIPDVVNSDELGQLVSPREPRALADAIERVLAQDHDEHTLSHANAIDWHESAQALLDVLCEVC